MTVTAIYRAIMLCVDERRQQLGLPMWRVDELAGTQDGYYAKALHADAPSGRQAQWNTLQLIVDALFPEGFDVVMRPAACALKGVDDLKRKLRHVTARYDPKTRRELMSELGSRPTKEARQRGRSKMSKSLRRKIARRAAKIRWEIEASIEKERDASAR